MTQTLSANKLEEIFISDYTENKTVISRKDSDYVSKLRDEAIKKFEEKGIPSVKDELWRFSNIRKVMDGCGRLIHPFTQPKDLNTPVEEIFQCDINELDTYDLALINGWYPQTMPLFQTYPGGARVGSLSEAFELYPEIIEEHYGKYANIEEPFTALNTAFATDGIFGLFPDNTQMEKPIQIVNLVTKEEFLMGSQMIQYRNLFVVGKNSHVKIVICDHTLSAEKSLTNSVIELFVDENSHVEIYRLQNQNNNGAQVTKLEIHQKKNSNVISNTITLNGGFVRNNQNVVLAEENSESNLYGTYLIDEEQHVDNNTFIHHKVPNCLSNELFKGILDENAKGAFRGLIKVDKDAQQTNSYQKNNNLLLTDTATMNTLPQLEIYADDVKCSHGATVGYLDAEEMFYLQARGISKKEARLLLMNAFVSEILDNIKIPVLQDRIRFLVNQRLRGELSHCATCVLRCEE
jgi:Fe-S cluster assembly protein SufD